LVWLCNRTTRLEIQYLGNHCLAEDMMIAPNSFLKAAAALPVVHYITGWQPAGSHPKVIY